MDEIHSHPVPRLSDIGDKAPVNDFRIACNDNLGERRELGRRLRLLRWLLVLLQEKHSWSPALLTFEFCRFLLGIGECRELIRLLNHRPFAEVVRNSLGFAFKYLVPNYLMRGTTGAECISCFLHHYRRMHSALPEHALRQIMRGDATFYEVSNGGNCFSLTIGLSTPPFDKEGELTLGLQVNGKTIFSMSFTIVPGWVVKSDSQEVLLISRLQGTLGCRPQMKLVRKYLYEYSPRRLLLAAVQGVADIFEVNQMVAVCADNQRSLKVGLSEILKKAYDDFFAKQGMVRTSAGFYSGPLSNEGKPLTSYQGRARARARKRRKMRQQIQSACTAFLLRATDHVVGTSSSDQKSLPLEMEHTGL